MGLLPDIIDGKILESAEDKRLKRFSNREITAEKRKKLEEALNRIKAKRALEAVQAVDSELAKLNNEGHNEVTEDFSDSPFADREELEDEEQQNEEN